MSRPVFGGASTPIHIASSGIILQTDTANIAALDLALGRTPGLTEDTKFGGVKLIDAMDNIVDVWRIADDNLVNRVDKKTFITSAQSLFIASDSVVDIDVDILVNYLDSDGVPRTVTPNLNGQTGVVIGVTALDCNRLTVDNGNTNVGNIYLTTENAFTGGVPDDLTKVLAFIVADKGQTLQALDTTPVGFRYHIKNILIYCSRASGATGSADVELQVRPNGKSWLTKRDFLVTTNSPIIKPEAGLVFDALTNIRARVIDVSDNDTNITFEWNYDLAAT